MHLFCLTSYLLWSVTVTPVEAEPGSLPIIPSSVTHISTFIADGTANVAERAIDGKLHTSSHTLGYWDTPAWFKMSFDRSFCFTEVVIIQSQLKDLAFRLEDAKVYVVNTDNGAEYLCGILKVRNEYTVEGQTYILPCDGKCGNEVKVTVLHEEGKYSNRAFINMREIRAYATTAELCCDAKCSNYNYNYNYIIHQTSLSNKSLMKTVQFILQAVVRD
ncbi:hypothetical protein ACHWQZ_G015902 [Mnemiopsis leidyi]